jgi:tRNA threonylcarbamoyl adenosine modification protein YeaZ
MKILALEFSSERRSVAVLDGARLAGEVVAESGGRRLQAFSLIEAALGQAGWERESVDCLAVGLGPGSYTGIRSAIAVAQGWQTARGVALLGLGSAAALAAQAQAGGWRGRIHLLIDAQRGEFYSASYEVGPAAAENVLPLRLITPMEAASLAQTGALVVGPDLQPRFPTAIILQPSAAALGKLAVGRQDFLPGDRLEPIYLRATTFVKAPAPRVFPS